MFRKLWSFIVKSNEELTNEAKIGSIEAHHENSEQEKHPLDFVKRLTENHKYTELQQEDVLNNSFTQEVELYGLIVKNVKAVHHGKDHMTILVFARDKKKPDLHLVFEFDQRVREFLLTKDIDSLISIKGLPYEIRGVEVAFKHCDLI